jgi:hypothetical protein
MDNIEFSFLDNFHLPFNRKNMILKSHYVYTYEMPSFIEMGIEDVRMKGKFFYKNIMPANDIDEYDLRNYNSRILELCNEFRKTGMNRTKRRSR